MGCVSLVGADCPISDHCWTSGEVNGDLDIAKQYDGCLAGCPRLQRLAGPISAGQPRSEVALYDVRCGALLRVAVAPSSSQAALSQRTLE